MIQLETKRLLLRRWMESDAESLYEYAKDPAVGPIAGWPVHTSVANSRKIIENVLSGPETYAVCLKENNRAIGSIGLMIGKASNFDLPDNEGEIGYWIGVPFWGQGLIPEACEEIIRHAFEDLMIDTLWCGYFDGNEKSKRVQEKCQFQYHHTNKDVLWALMNDIRTEHVTQLTKQRWECRQSCGTNALGNNQYQDIINLPHHQSKTRSHMPNEDRAAQFSPFAALTGYDAAVAETARLTGSKIEPDEYELDMLNKKLNKLREELAKEPEVVITYFVADDKKTGGSYQTNSGAVKRIDDYEQLIIMMDGLKIPIADVLAIDGELFKAF